MSGPHKRGTLPTSTLPALTKETTFTTRVGGGLEVASVPVISYDMTGVAASYDFLTERRLLRSNLLA